MSVRVNVRIFKIMRTPIKVEERTYVTYANCRTLTRDIPNSRDISNISSFDTG